MSNSLKSIATYFKNIDHTLLFVPIICVIYGLILISSATLQYASTKFIIVQAAAAVIGLIGFVVVSFINFEDLSGFWKALYVMNIILIALLIPLGEQGDSGNRSWIRFAGIGIQPAEIGKLIFIVTFAKHLTLAKSKINHPLTILQLGLHLMIIAGFIVVVSADTGMALSYVVIFIFMIFAAGLSIKWFASAFILGISAIPIVWNLFLKPYQKNRILVIFDPSIDPDVAYQATQSKIAIGAGQTLGMGYAEGNQTQHGLLPAKHTDFIFSVAGEEFGFLGCALIILLLSIIIIRLFYLYFSSSSPFSSLMCAGIGGMFLFQTFQNIFMCLGIMPVVGLTLPFFSYGGTSVVTMFLAVGMAAGVHMREKPFRLQN